MGKNVRNLVAIALAAISIAAVAGVCVNAIQTYRQLVRLEEMTAELKRIKLALHNYGEGKQPISPGPAATPGQPRPLRFETYSGYFVSNQFEPDAAESFLVVTDPRQFDKVFGAARVMGDTSHRLARDAFHSNLVLAAIRRGKAVWEFKVESVSVKDGVVELRYASTSKKSESAEFACPLIVSIPKGPYQSIRFIENGKAVKTIPLSDK